LGKAVQGDEVADAEVPAIGIGLRKYINSLVIHDVLDLTGREFLRSDGDALFRSICVVELLHEIDEDICASPFARVNAAEKIDPWPIRARPLERLDLRTVGKGLNAVGATRELFDRMSGNAQKMPSYEICHRLVVLAFDADPILTHDRPPERRLGSRSQRRIAGSCARAADITVCVAPTGRRGKLPT